jgi:cytochrome c biogenesis protein CcmG, thiol:disulfide interchange protein DsbE
MRRTIASVATRAVDLMAVGPCFDTVLLMFRARRTVVLGCVIVAAAAFAACGADEPAAPATGAKAAALRDGGVPAFERELQRLQGRPVVVNQWASWCGPCRAEFPIFQRLAERYRGRVAFLGVNSQDSRQDAEKFLTEYPTPFAHFSDPDAKIARTFRGGRAWPTTAFYTADGELNFTHQGQYRDDTDLDRDIRRYAIDG